MFKLIVLSAIIAVSSAGIIAGPVAHSAPIVVAHAAPVPVAVAHAPVHHAVATSYQNSNSISVHPVPVVAHAPVAVAHAPVAYGLGLDHGYYH